MDDERDLDLLFTILLARSARWIVRWASLAAYLLMIVVCAAYFFGMNPFRIDPLGGLIIAIILSFIARGAGSVRDRFSEILRLSDLSREVKRSNDAHKSVS